MQVLKHISSLYKTAVLVDYKSLLRGLISMVPGLYLLYKQIHGDGRHSSASARFCYSFWLRLLVKLHEENLMGKRNDVAELGCADSLGIGIIAVITGSSSYTALELRSFDFRANSFQLFDEIVELFVSKTDIPDDSEFPKISLKLSDYTFPSRIIPPPFHDALCNPERLAAIRKNLESISAGEIGNMFSYVAPWDSRILELKGRFDLVFSRAVMEHVTEADEVYSRFYDCLKPFGLMFHDIEYNCHHTSKYWNGHWAIPNLVWMLIKGKRPMMINRLSHSVHHKMIASSGYKVLDDFRVLKESKLPRDWISYENGVLPFEDFSTYGGWFLAEKN